MTINPDTRLRVILGAAAAFFVAAFALAGVIAPVASRLAALADPRNAVVRYLAEYRPPLDAPGPWLRVALFLYPAALLAAAALAPLTSRLRFPARAGVLFRGWGKYAWTYGAALAILVAASRLVFGGEPREFDETAYLLQARIFAEGRLWAEPPPTEKAPVNEGDELDNFFVGSDRLEVLVKGRWFTIYGPLHPFLLALGYLARAPWLVNPLAAAAVPPLLVALAGYVKTRAHPAVVAALALTSPFWLFNGASFMSEGTWLPTFALFLLLYWRALARPTPARFAAAGVALGLAAVNREWNTFVSALPFVAHASYTVFRKDGPRRPALWLFAGAAPVLAAYVLYNGAVTGKLFTLARDYSRQQHFGFGEAHTVGLAAQWGIRNLYVMSSDLFGWPLLCLVPLAIYPFLARPLPLFAKLFYGMAATTLAGNFFVENPGIVYGPRYYMGVLPGAVILTAAAAGRLADRLATGRRLAAGPKRAGAAVATLLALLICVNLALYLPATARKYHGYWFLYKPWAASRLKSYLAAARVAPAVVFVAPRERFRGPMPNGPALEDDIVYARHQPGRDGELMTLFPGRRYFICDYDVFDRTGELYEITPTAVYEKQK